MTEYVLRPRSNVRPKVADKDLSARLFLEHIKKLPHNGSYFFRCEDERNRKRLETKIRVRLWRYAEAGYIKFREFNVWNAEDGFSLIRNVDPLEKHEKRNLKRKRGRVV